MRLPVFIFVTSDVSKWDELVQKPAFDLIDEFINDPHGRLVEDDCDHAMLARLKFGEPNNTNGEWKKHFCEKCNVTCNGETEYAQHLKSKQHRNRKKPDSVEAARAKAKAKSQKD